MSEKNFSKKFQTKKEILGYLGKDVEDRKLIDRMIKRGDIKKVDGEYQLIEKEDPTEYVNKIKELENKIFELELELDTFRDETVGQITSEDIDRISANLEYREKKAKRNWKAIYLVIDMVYNKVSPMLKGRIEEREEFKEAILDAVREQLGRDE